MSDKHPEPLDKSPSVDLQDVDLSQIITKAQVREQITDVDDLADSIRSGGLHQPIIIRARGGNYELVAGERRFRAAEKLGLKSLPCIVKPASLTDLEALEIQIIENVQREDLNPMEEARAFRRYMDITGYTARKLAEKIGKNETTVTRALRYLKMPEDIQTIIANGEISKSAARELARFKDEETMREYLVLVTSGEITAADVAAIASKKARKSQKAKAKKSPPGLSFRTEEGLEISVRLPTKKTDVRWTYHHVAEALAEATEEVQLRIRNRIELSDG